MLNLNKQSYIFTSDGYKKVNNVQPKEYVSTTDGMSSINYLDTVKAPLALKDFTYLQTSIYAFSSLLHNNDNVQSVNPITFDLKPKKVKELQIDDWLFHPWLKDLRPESSINIIDLSKSCNCSFDSKYIYTYDKKIVEAAEALDITTHQLKELLSREAAEYEKHLPALKEYIKSTFGIEEADNDIQAFKKLKKHLKDNCTFKQNRFLTIDQYSLSCIVAYMKSAYLSPLSYKIYITFDSTSQEYKDALLFIKNQKFKYELTENNSNQTTVVINNEPFYLFLENVINNTITCIKNSNKENQQFFIKHLFNTNYSVDVSFTVALQLAELCNYDKKVLSIDNSSVGVTVHIAQDDLTQTDSSLIIQENGYFTRVVGLSEIEANRELIFKKVSASGKDINYLTHTLTFKD